MPILKKSKLGMVAHTYNLSTWGDVPGQPSLKKIRKKNPKNHVYFFSLIYVYSILQPRKEH